MLDPTDRPTFRALAHRMLDDSLDAIESIAEGRVWQPVPQPVRDAFADSAVPTEPRELQAVYQRFEEEIAPFTVGNRHPRFFGWVHGTGTPSGTLAAMLAAGLNINCGGREHAAVYAEREVIRWWAEIFGFPAESSGIITSGTSLATIIALAVARYAAAGPDIRRAGVGREVQLTAYAGASVHNCVPRALDLLGIGNAALRLIPNTAEGGLNTAKLADALRADRDAGRRPFLLIGTVGSVDTGASDDLRALSNIAAAEKLWLHVDGAFGAMTVLAPELRHITAGIEHADSLATDFHKWLHVPYGAGLMLTRHAKLHRETFASHVNYLAREHAGTAGGDPWFCDFGPELSRGFVALPVWMAMQEFGTNKLGETIARNCAQARKFAELLRKISGMIIAAPVHLNIVCARFANERWTGTEADERNLAIAVRLQESGIAVPSTTRVDGQLVLRFNFTNHRTADEDLRIVADALRGMTP